MTKSRVSTAPPSRYPLGLLKTTVVAGSMLATILGTQLLAQSDGRLALDTEPVSQVASTINTDKPMGELLPWLTTLKPIPTVASAELATQEQALPTPSVLASIPTLAPLPDVVQPSTVRSSGAATTDASAVLSFDLKEIKPVQMPAPVTSSRSSR